MKSKILVFLIACLITSWPAQGDTPRPLQASSIYNGDTGPNSGGVLYIPNSTPFGNRAAFFDNNSTLSSSVTTATELSFVHGVTSSIQTQIDNVGGSAITQLLGDVLATGPGATTATLATTGVSPGSYTNANITIDAKGRVTAAASGSGSGALWGTITGTLSNQTDLQNALNAKQNSLTFGDLTSSAPFTVTGGSGAVIGSGASISVSSGYYFPSTSDQTNWNGKQSALTFGDLTDSGTDGISILGGTGAIIGAGATVAQHVADSSHNGYLASSDWSIFNAKQAAGNYLTQLTGDVAAIGPGATTATIQPLAVTNSKIANATIDLTAKVNGLLPNANVASIPAPEIKYIDFLLGSDVACPATPCGDGSSMRPWHSLNYAYASVTDESVNKPYTFILSGGNNDPDTGTINAKPNIALYAQYPIQISQPFTVGPDDVGGVGNDVLSFTNITFLFTFTFVKNDTSENTIFATDTDFNAGPIIKQTGSGWMFFDGVNVVTNNAEFKTGDTGALFFNPYFNGTLTFDDATSAAYYQFMGGYLGGHISITGAPFVYSSGMMIDVPFGATWTNVHSANGDPTIQFDSAGLPPSVTGVYSSVFSSFSQYVGYTPTTPGNWSPVPSNAMAALDQLAARSGGGITSLNGLATATQLFATGTAGSNFTISSSGSTHTFNIPTGSSSARGLISSADWTTFNNKQNALTIGNLTDVGTDGIAVTGGTGAVIGSGTAIAQQKADATHNGYLSSADWTTFNSGASGANQQLSNLGTTAVNANISPSLAKSGLINLGDGTHQWGSAYIGTLVDPSGVDSVRAPNRTLRDTTGGVALDWSAFPGDIYIYKNLDINNSNSTGYVQIRTAGTSASHYKILLPSAQSTGALTNDGAGNLSWTPASSGGRTVNGVSTTFTIPSLTKDYLLTADTTSGSFTVTLPDATASSGFCALIKDIGANDLTIATQLSQTIDGGSSVTIHQNDADTICSNGTAWYLY